MEVVVTWLGSNAMGVVGAVHLLLEAMIAICLFIPGEQPEAFFRKAADFLAKFSKK